MTYRMTIVLEYPSVDAAPRVNARTRASDLGAGEVVAVQFSDALRELEILDSYATEAAKRAAQRAALDYAAPSSGRPTDRASGSQP